MTKKKTTAPAYLTREILKEEISASEQRLNAKIDGVEQRLDTKIDSKIDSATLSFKEYVDGRLSQVEDRLQSSIDQLGKKIDTNTAGIVDLIERRVGEIMTIHTRVDDHEHRIGMLEAKE